MFVRAGVLAGLFAVCGCGSSDSAPTDAASTATPVYLPRTSEVDFGTQFKAHGKKLTIDSIPVCPGKAGQYTRRAAGKTLTLTVTGDKACKARAARFGGTWTRR